MPAGQHLARLLVIALAGAGIAGCAPTPQASTGQVISIDPKVCVTAETGANYCFEQPTVEKKVPGVKVGDCLVFTHTPPTSPGGLSRLESMSRCGEEDPAQDADQDQGGAEDQEEDENQ